METVTQIIVAVAGLVIANFGIKFGRVLPLLRKAFELTKNQLDFRKDKKLTQVEKAKLYDDIEGIVKEAYSILRGLFPNKTK
jgi:hypothetical protein